MKTKTILLMGVTTILMTSCYDFNREQAEKDAESEGKQVLYEAEYSKQAKVEQAKADFESAKYDAETKQLIVDAEVKASITKAEGDAKTTLIQAEATKKKTEMLIQSFGGVDNYLNYLMITGLNNTTNKVYIPTEAGMPILEAK